MSNAIVGTLMLAGLAHLRDPVGILSASYVRVRGQPFASTSLRGRHAERRASIVIGVSSTLLRAPVQHSRPGGRARAGNHDDPIIARTTEELLLLVPNTMRRARLALVRRALAPYSASCFRCRAGIIPSGPALARIAGETRRSLHRVQQQLLLDQPQTALASLTVQIYTTRSRLRDWHRQPGPARPSWCRLCSCARSSRVLRRDVGRHGRG